MKKMIEEEKAKRMKVLGTSKQNMKRFMTGKNDTLQQKKQKKSFTGRKIIGEEIQDLDELDKEQVRKLLINHGVLKAKKGEIDNKRIGSEIAAENSVYLFNRHSCFRRNIYYI